MEDEVVAYLKNLRNEIIAAFESLEPSQTFKRTPWDFHAGSGGGEMSVLRGDVFEKAAVNWSGVRGDKAPFNADEGHFFATGVSLITPEFWVFQAAIIRELFFPSRFKDGFFS